MKKLFFGVLSVVLVFTFLTACSLENASSSGSDYVKENLIVYGDLVNANGCVLQSRYTAGDKIVFRMNVLDPATGEQVEDAKVTLHLSTGEEMEMHFGPHPTGVDGAPMFWTVGYPITEEIPTGTLEYYVTAESSDRSGEFRPFEVKPSLITIVTPDQVTTN